MFCRSMAAGLGFMLLLPVNYVLAQATVTSVQPRTCIPGATTRLTITGSGFEAGLRAVTSCGSAEIRVESVEAEKATCDLTLPADVPLGPLGLWLATSAGPAEPLILMVDDLPAVAAEAGHHSPESAQPIPTLAAVSGTSGGANSDYYRFEVAAGQRVAFEVLTQPLESTMDPVVRLLDANGQTLQWADDDEVGPDCRFSYQFSEAGEYVLKVRDNRYTAGGAYYLRIGDFPILRHAHPLAVAAGERATIRFHGADAAQAEPREIEFAADQQPVTTTVATRLPGGQSSAWVPIRVSDLPPTIETDAAASETAAGDQPLAFPLSISGRLAEPQQRDAYTIQGVKDAVVRVRSRTRSLGCATLLRMRLLNSAGNVVAETAVSEADEWSFDYTFPDAAAYRLEVSDLLGRGGGDFGYCVEVVPAGTFAIEMKADASGRQRFAMVPGGGACAIDLQVQRFGYDGEIELSLDGIENGVRILNPRIAAGATEARVYLVAEEPWTVDSLAAVGLHGRASAAPSLRIPVTSLAWQRVAKPHVPFPIGWRDGVFLLGGASGIEDYFAIAPEAPIRLARPINRHTTKLTLRRSDEAFKGAVAILPGSLPAGWQMEVAADGDVYTTTWTRSADAVDQPEQLRLLVFSEHQNRGHLDTVEVPLEWFDPLRIGMEASGPLVAGRPASFAATIDRQGDDPQPVTLKLSGLPEGISGPESLTVAADQNRVEFELQVAAGVASSESATITLMASSLYQGQEFTVTAHSAPLTILGNPAAVEIYPEEVSLLGRKDRRQLVVTGYDETRSPRDWTRDAVISSANPEVAEVRGTSIFPRGNGETQIAIQVGAHRQSIPVRVAGMEIESPPAFEADVLVALSKQGCNSGACHGSPSGKGMFRLSLRAFDRKLDELTLIREDFGRRVNPLDPERSLLLLKPLMKVSHGGGKQLHPEDEAYAILRDWIAAGAPADPPGAPRCVRLEVAPQAKRVLRLNGGPQQLAAVAHFSDGSSRDVTHLVAYESSSMDVAKVSHSGLVTPQKRGETVILVRYLEHIESVPLMFTEQVPQFVWQAPPPHNYIDELVDAKLQQLQYLPSDLCSDAEFIRRVYLDVIGILPTVEESRAFLDDASSDKRARLIDHLLEREEFAKYWALKWGDLLKMTGKLVGDEGVHKYHRWVEEALRSNMPYDEFARQLITASGSTLANPPANFYRTATDMNESVENVSQLFLGARLQCAKCHNHPFERWTQDNYYGLGAFFNRIQRRSTQRGGEMFVWTSTSGEVTQPRTGEQMKPWLPGEGSIEVDNDVDRRLALAEWLVQPDNPYFARIEVNRIWAQLFSRGIVDPIDDFRDSNPPVNAPLLDALAKDFADSGFDRRHILRTILNSRTYQSSSDTHEFNRDDTLYFSHQQPRLLSAEPLLDAINQSLGLEQTLGNLPPGTKATHLPAPDLVKVEFLKVFGQPERTTVCECERVDDSNLGMAIELLNGSMLHEKLRDANNRFRRAAAAGRPLPEVIEEMYLATVCRRPEASELQAAIDHCTQHEEVVAGLEDLCWALLNTEEFLFQH